MGMHGYLPADHPLARIYRVGAAILGSGLIAFGGLGFATGLPFLAVNTEPMMMGQLTGLGSNGLLSAISVLTGAVLVAAAARGGALASTTMLVVGVLFLISGLGNLAVLDTTLNLLAFRIPNVVFSLIVGTLLVLGGAHGRLSGGLPDDNPYVRARGGRTPDATATPHGNLAVLAGFEDMATAEYAVANGTATAEQAELVRRDRLRRAQAHHRRAHERAGRQA